MNNSVITTTTTTAAAAGTNLTELLSLPVTFTVDPLKPITVKKSRLSLDGKDQKTKERILRNRAAAQESRDKKRKYVADLEDTSKKLTEENQQLNKRLKQLEEQNSLLQSQFDVITQQLNALQQVKVNLITPSILFNDFCDSARIAKKNQVKFIVLLKSTQ